MTKLISFLALTLLLAFLISCSDDGNSTNYNETEALIGNSVGEKLPELIMTDANGNKVSDTDYRGKYVVYKSWRSNCGACISSFPNDKQMQEKYKKDVKFVALNISDTYEKWQDVIEELDLNSLTNFVDNGCVQSDYYSQSLIQYMEGRYIPFYVVVDRYGVVQYASNQSEGRYYDFLEKELGK